MNYDQKIDSFCSDKEFIRLARPLRDRADVSCDACGSPHPRILFGLQEESTGRYYFVGDSCLRVILQRGVVLKRFSKEATSTAYTEEMERRAGNAAVAQAESAASPAAVPGQTTPELKATTAVSHGSVLSLPIVPVIVLSESADYYQGLAIVISNNGVGPSWGFVRESRYAEVRQDVNGAEPIRQSVRVERDDALARCLRGAWERAFAPNEGPESQAELPRELQEALQRSAHGRIPELAASLLGLTTWLGGTAAASRPGEEQ